MLYEGELVETERSNNNTFSTLKNIARDAFKIEADKKISFEILLGYDLILEA